MKNKRNAGFSLVEVLVSMAVLALVVIPLCTGLVMSVRMNAKADALLKAQLAVSSTVEQLMAEGITHASPNYDVVVTDGVEEDVFPDVQVKTSQDADAPDYYYNVEVSSNDGLITVTTTIRKGGGTE